MFVIQYHPRFIRQQVSKCSLSVSYDSIIPVIFWDVLSQVVWRGRPVKLVRIFNPWGQGEWNRDWSDRSESLTFLHIIPLHLLLGIWYLFNLVSLDPLCGNLYVPRTKNTKLCLTMENSGERNFSIQRAKCLSLKVILDQCLYLLNIRRFVYTTVS